MKWGEFRILRAKILYFDGGFRGEPTPFEKSELEPQTLPIPIPLMTVIALQLSRTGPVHRSGKSKKGVGFSFLPLDYDDDSKASGPDCLAIFPIMKPSFHGEI